MQTSLKISPEMLPLLGRALMGGETPMKYESRYIGITSDVRNTSLGRGSAPCGIFLPEVTNGI